ncbi:MAG: hypothetical protein IPG66_03580 [Hydrogenophilales bacterium]|nr:hypothetical protein [Hydrogenophilales bacterium]
MGWGILGTPHLLFASQSSLDFGTERLAGGSKATNQRKDVRIHGTAPPGYAYDCRMLGATGGGVLRSHNAELVLQTLHAWEMIEVLPPGSE